MPSKPDLPDSDIPETISACWRRFARTPGVTSSAGTPDRRRMEQSFYAGAFAMLSMVQRLGGSKLSTQAVAERLVEWQYECERWHDGIRAGGN